jgi:hypothetical protein
VISIWNRVEKSFILNKTNVFLPILASSASILNKCVRQCFLFNKTIVQNTKNKTNVLNTPIALVWNEQTLIILV